MVEIKNDADKLHELRKARDMAATEARNYGNNARAVERRRLQNEETEEEKRFILTQKKISKKYYKNIDAYNEAERLLNAKPTEGTGFQKSRHPYKMKKDGKYGKLTIDVPQSVEKHRLLEKEAGVVLLDTKRLILILLILLVKEMIQKRNTLINQKLYPKHELNYQVLKIRKEVRNLKI